MVDDGRCPSAGIGDLLFADVRHLIAGIGDLLLLMGDVQVQVLVTYCVLMLDI